MTSINDLPTKFQEIKRFATLPDGISLLDRMLDAEIEFDIVDDLIDTKVVGIEYVRGVRQRHYTISNKHDWALVRSQIRPLPRDIMVHLEQSIEGNHHTDIKYIDALQLLRSEHFALPVKATDRFFESGQKGTESLSDQIRIPGLMAQLFRYQATGVEWMRRVLKRASGFILADEMGLGKTLQIIALLLTEQKNSNKPALVVCPSSLLVNWMREFEKFAPSLCVGLHHGVNRTGDYRKFLRFDVIISTYETVVMDVSLFCSFRWSWLICDEAQAIKNPYSQRRISLATLLRERTVLMTGTPVENSLLDLWSLVDFAAPNMFGTIIRFQQDFPETEELAQNSAERLRQYTEPITLRRMVTDVAGDLPERIDIELPIALDDDLRQHYREVRQETLAEYAVAGGLVATLRLQLLCAHPRLNRSYVDCDNIEHTRIMTSEMFRLRTAKVDRTIDLLKEAFGNKSKVLVFSLFNSVGDILFKAGESFPEVYWNAINGSTPQNLRQEIIDDFSTYEGAGCLILNPKAAGAGLNITAATVVIHFTPVWNPALEAQASARAHRRGQTAPVTIYQLYYTDTVEQVMMERLLWKRNLGNAITSVSTRDKDDINKALRIEPKP